MNESEIFNAAVKLSADERAKFLNLACKDNPALRSQVAALLKAHNDSQTFLGDAEESLAPRRRDAGRDDQRDMYPRPVPARREGEGRVRALREEYDETSAGYSEIAGTIVGGKYKLLEAIGEGGMGMVWLAEQSAPVKRRVALKLVKPGMDSRHVLARFEVERQALALMDHPNIAKVYDGGVTEQGRPYFVMEYVKGIPFTEYCDQARLPLRQRLQLFASVCQAVQHAHQKGIIHRDLKPSNILACLYDGVPVPKVIDFGLAKAMSQPLTEQSLFTAHGMMVGTPMYMSPEQAEHNNLDVDTRTDIYSLGVILYELLTGSTPLGRQQLKDAAMNEVLRLIKDVEPPKPSTRISGSASLPSIAAQRSIEPKLLRKSLSGDLDWIVMKALEKERSRRYETANGFAADINRYLAGEAVLAHPPSQAYRMRKFLRKNKGPVLAASLVFLALLAGIVGTAMGLKRADAQRVIAEAKQKEADAQREIAVAKQTEAEAQRAKAIASAEAEAEQRKRAEKAEDETLNDYRASTDDSIEQLIGSKESLGPQERAYIKNTLERWKKFADRVGDDERGRAIRGEAHHRIGILWSRLGQSEEALAEYQVARQIRKELAEQFSAAPEYRNDLAKTYSNLGNLLIDLGKPEEGRKEFVVAIEIGNKLVDQLPDVPAYQRTLARVHTGLGRAIGAFGDVKNAQIEKQLARELLENLVNRVPNEPEYREALARNRYEKGFFLGPNNPEQAEREHEAAIVLSKSLTDEFPTDPGYLAGLAIAYSGLSQTHRALEKYGKALAECRAALEIQKNLVKQFPAIPNHRESLAVKHDLLSISLRDFVRLEEAISEMHSARDILEKLIEQFPDEPSYKSRFATQLENWGVRFTELKRLDQARTALETVVSIRQDLADQFPDVFEYRKSLGRAQSNYAELLKDQGKLDESLEWFNRSLETLERFPQGQRQASGFGPLEACHEGRAQTYHRLKKYSEAIKDFDFAVKFSGDDVQPIFRASRARSFALNDQVPEAIAEVVALINSGPFDAKGWYNFACVYSVASGNPGAPGADKQQEYADRAIEFLNKAVSVGYKDTELIGQDIELDPLREREDFKKLLAELNAKYPPIDPAKSEAAQFSVNWAKVFPYYVEALHRHRELQGSEHPDTINAIRELADAQTKLKEFVAAQRNEFPADDPGFGNLLAQASLALLQCDQYAAAEEMLRECLAIREKTQPEQWRTFNTKSMLGGSLRGQTKYDEAEPLLLAGYDGMKQRESAMSPEEKFRLVEAMERLVALFTATGKTDQAAEWKKKLDEYNAFLNPKTPVQVAANSEPKPKETAKAKTGAPAIAVSDLIVQASQASRAHEWDKAEKLLKGALVNSPDDPQILLGLVETYQQHGQQLLRGGSPVYSHFGKSAECLHKLFEIEPELRKSATPEQLSLFGLVLYNEACVFALGGESDKAIASLREALAVGLADLTLLDTDADLNSLRDLPAFKALKASAQKSAEGK